MTVPADPLPSPLPGQPGGDTPPATEQPNQPMPPETAHDPSRPDDVPITDSGAPRPTALDAWKDALRQDFQRWLDALDAIPEPATEPNAADPSDAPDLCAFYAQLAAANTEARKANRRTAEAISQWGDTLARFDDSLGPLRQAVVQLAAAQPGQNEMSSAHCLLLVELLDRVHRLARAFASPPPAKTAWWRTTDPAWPKAWNVQRQALDILVGHLEALLENQGVTRIPALGQPFDPNLMIAVAAEPAPSRPAQSVLEELAAGYCRHGQLLRAAQVKVVRNL